MDPRALLFVCASVVAAAATGTTSCEAPNVHKGQPTNLTCYFSTDVSKTKDDITVLKYDNDWNDTTVLIYAWPGPEGKVVYRDQNYSFDGHNISSTLVVVIPSVSEQHVGRYECQTTSSDNFTRCSLEIIPEAANDSGLEETTGQNQKNGSNEIQREGTASERPNHGNYSGEGSVSGEIIAGAVAAVVFLVALVIFLIFFCFSKRRRRSLQMDDATKIEADDHNTISMSDMTAADKQSSPLRFADDEIESTHLLAGDENQSSQEMRVQEKEVFNACKTGDVNKLKDICVSYPGSRSIKDSNDNSLLHVACRYDQVGVVKQLLLWGADMDARNDQFRTPLHVASYYGATTVIDVLLENKMKIEDRDDDGYTALHVACEGRKKSEDTFGGTSKSNNMNGDSKISDDMSNTTQVDVVLKLLHAGASRRAVDAKGRTPLHLACLTGNEAVVKTLLAATTKDEGDALSATSTCEVNFRDPSGQTPLHMACMAGSKEIVQILISYGADLTSEDKNGLTPELLAKKCGHEDIAKHLSKALKHKQKVGEG